MILESDRSWSIAFGTSNQLKMLTFYHSKKRSKEIIINVYIMLEYRHPCCHCSGFLLYMNVKKRLFLFVTVLVGNMGSFLVCLWYTKEPMFVQTA